MKIRKFIEERKGQGGFPGLIAMGIFLIAVIVVAGIALKMAGVIGGGALPATIAGLPLATVTTTTMVAGTPQAELNRQLNLINQMAASGNLGKAATLNVKAFDKQASSSAEVTSSINGSVFVAQWNGDGWGEYVKVKDKNAYSFGDAGISVSTGDKVLVTGIDEGYYCDPILKGKTSREVVVTAANMNVEMICHVHSSDGSMKIQGYDNTGSTQLSAPTNSSQENGDISAIAGEELTYFLELKNNDDASLRRVCAIGILGTNLTKKVEPLGITKIAGGAVLDTATLSKSKPGWSTYDTGCPDSMCEITMNPDQSAATGWEDVWYITSTSTNKWLELSGSQSVKLNLKVKIGNNNPVTTQTISEENKASVIFKDCGSFEAKDGSNAFGITDNTDDETDVGVDETDTNAISSSTGTSASAGPIYGVELI